MTFAFDSTELHFCIPGSQSSLAGTSTALLFIFKRNNSTAATILQKCGCPFRVYLLVSADHVMPIRPRRKEAFKLFAEAPSDCFVFSFLAYRCCSPRRCGNLSRIVWETSRELSPVRGPQSALQLNRVFSFRRINGGVANLVSLDYLGFQMPRPLPFSRER